MLLRFLLATIFYSMVSAVRRIFFRSCRVALSVSAESARALSVGRAARMSQPQEGEGGEWRRKTFDLAPKTEGREEAEDYTRGARQQQKRSNGEVGAN